eukprot:5143552-Amphidinium_carterae.1
MEHQQVQVVQCTGQRFQHCDLDSVASCGKPIHDIYLYLEDDVSVPRSSFTFWVCLHKSVFLSGLLVVVVSRLGMQQLCTNGDTS